MIIKALAGSVALVPFIFSGFPPVQQNLGSRVKRGLYLLEEHDDAREVESYLTVWCDHSVMVSLVPLFGLDLDLRDPVVAAQTLGEYRGIRWSKKIEKGIPGLSEQEFFEFMKTSALLGRWYTEIWGESEKVYRLFEALGESRIHFLREYFSLRQRTAPGLILSSVLTFFERIRDYRDSKEGLSDYYKKRILKVRHQEKNLLASALWLMNSPRSLPQDLKVIMFCLKLRGGKL